MTDPRTPGEAIARSAARLNAQREAALRLSEEIAAQREKDAQSAAEGREEVPQ